MCLLVIIIFYKGVVAEMHAAIYKMQLLTSFTAMIRLDREETKPKTKDKSPVYCIE